MSSYDHGKYHDESVADLGLPKQHADHHLVYFLRWLINNDLMSDEFIDGSEPTLAQYHNGKVTIFELFEWWDRCLAPDMLSPQGRAFSDSYFVYEHGSYLDDYVGTLGRSLPTEFHVSYNDTNYRLLATVLDRRFREWVSTQNS